MFNCTKKLCFSPENSAEGLGSRRECCRGYVSVYESTPKKLLQLPPESCHNLMFQGRAQLEHSSHMVKVGVEVTC